MVLGTLRGHKTLTGVAISARADGRHALHLPHEAGFMGIKSMAGPEFNPADDVPADREEYEAWERASNPETMDNDTRADMAAAEVLQTLEAPIAGQPSMTIHNYENARRIVKAALLAVFDAGG